jgi:predicted nuclease with TOPRIM domain
MTLNSIKSEYVTRTEWGEYMFKTDRKFEDLTTIMLGEFDKVYVKFGEIDKRFEAIEVRLDSLEIRFDNLEKRFDALETSLNDLHGKFDIILNHLVIQDQSIQSILTYIKK